jgi:hypothetical protein
MESDPVPSAELLTVNLTHLLSMASQVLDLFKQIPRTCACGMSFCI